MTWNWLYVLALAAVLFGLPVAILAVQLWLEKRR